MFALVKVGLGGLVEEQLFGREAVAVAYAVASEEVQVCQLLCGHLVHELPGGYLFEKSIDSQLAAEINPGGDTDTSIAHGFEDIEVLDKVTESQNDGDVIIVTLCEGARHPGTEQALARTLATE